MEMSEKKVPRVGSLISSDPQEQLIKLFHKKNHEKFVTLLENELSVQVNYWYGEENGTILDLCCIGGNSYNFLDTLLNHGSNPNVVNKVKKKAPIHFVIERKDKLLLDRLLQHEGIDVNIPDTFGNTPLHYAVKLNQVNSNVDDTQCLQILLNNPNININIQNRKGQTAAHLAASQGNKDALLLLILKSDIDLDSSKDPAGKSARDIINQKYKDLLLPQAEDKLNTATDKDLFKLLRSNELKIFKDSLLSNKDLIDDAHDGLYTLLQYSCEHGLADVVDLLVELGADLDKAQGSLQYTPIMIASKKGYVKIIQTLVSTDKINYAPVNMETVLHCVVNGSVESIGLGDENIERNHLKCLDILLTQVHKNMLDLNQCDSKGNTALHCAGKIGDEEMVFALLNAGAYIGKCNFFNDPVIACINPNTLEKYLDKCVKTNDKLPREEGYEIIINYRCFVPPSKAKIPSQSISNIKPSVFDTLSETDLLLYICKSPDLRYLLRHPMITSLIFMKWYTIRKWFYINLLFYLIFWALLSIYILGIYDTRHIKSNGNNTNDSIENYFSSSNKSNPFWIALVIFLGFLILRELFQLLKSFRQYIINPENWLEVSLIGITFAILFLNTQVGIKQQLAAIGILLSWTELVLLIGKHPALSTNIEMLKTVALNFSKFLAWYSILIVAFALSFYTLFRDAPDADNNLFIHPGISIFKTVVMLTGEFEAGDIPFVQYPVTSHLLFVLFVFSIAIVLYNLLNGLAVSDTQAIKSDAEMVGYTSRVKLVSYIETIDPSSCRMFLNNMKCLIWNSDSENQIIENRKFSWQKSLFSEITDYEIHIFPNESNKIEFSSTAVRIKRNEFDDSTKCCLFDSNNCNAIIMDSSIVKSAQMLLNEKSSNQLNNEQSYSNKSRELIKDNLLIEYRNTLEAYKNILKQYSEQIRLMEMDKKTPSLSS